MKKQKGQALILTLVITAASLVVGMAISSRAVSTLRETSRTAQAGKAQKAADAGIEETLAKDLSDPQNFDGSCTSYPCTKPTYTLDGAEVTVTVEELGGGTTPIQFTAKKDETKQINLTNTSLKKVRISWNGDALITYSVIHKDASGAVSLQQKGASDPNESDACSLPTGSSDPSVLPGSGYDHQITAEGLSVGAGEELYLRLRPLCETNVSLQVEGLNSAGAAVNLPSQGHKITSKGSYGETEWTVEATKMNAALPSVFDYAIFSESDLTK